MRGPPLLKISKKFFKFFVISIIFVPYIVVNNYFYTKGVGIMGKSNPRTVYLTALNEVTSKKPNCLTVKVGESRDYVDGQPSNKLTSTYVDVLIKGLGAAKVVFPYRAGLAEELDRQLEFGERFALTDIGVVQDAKISIYDGGLSIKFLMVEKEEEGESFEI